MPSVHAVLSLLLAASVLADDSIVKEPRHLVGQCDCENGSRGQLAAGGQCICTDDHSNAPLLPGQCRCGGLIGALDKNGICSCDHHVPSEPTVHIPTERRHLIGQCDCENGSRGQLAKGGQCICTDDHSDAPLPLGQCRCGGLIGTLGKNGICSCDHHVPSEPTSQIFTERRHLIGQCDCENGSRGQLAEGGQCICSDDHGNAPLPPGQCQCGGLIGALGKNGICSCGRESPISPHLGSSNTASIAAASVPQNLRGSIVPTTPKPTAEFNTGSKIAIAISGTAIAVGLVALMTWGIIALTKFAGTFT